MTEDERSNETMSSRIPSVLALIPFTEMASLCAAEDGAEAEPGFACDRIVAGASC